MLKNNSALFDEIQKTIHTFNFDMITAERKEILIPLVNFVQSKVAANAPVRLNFICTHNSRRSHLAQIWAQTASAFYEINQVNCYSGGTDITAMFPMIATTLQRAGFKIKKIGKGKNPIYCIKYSKNDTPIIGFSKKYDDDFNPETEFAAIMTCSQADGGCPFISGAINRIPITFEDPKAFDNSFLQEGKYRERSFQIAMEMFYVFSKIKS